MSQLQRAPVASFAIEPHVAAALDLAIRSSHPVYDCFYLALAIHQDTHVVTDDIDSLDLNTGELLGTPGYMAPEQLQRAAEAGRPADIYALGSILFEILNAVVEIGVMLLKESFSGPK